VSRPRRAGARGEDELDEQRPDGPEPAPAGQAGSWRSRNIVALGLVSFFTDIHSEMILALLPQYMANVLGLPRDVIGLVEGVADAAASFLRIASGWFSDRLGRRKPVVVAGYALSTAVKPLLVLATTGWHVGLIRTADRLGKGIRSSARDALVAESVAPEQRGRAFGFHRAMDTAGAIVGTALAIVLLKLLSGDYRRVFLLAAAGGVAAIFTLLTGVRDRKHDPGAAGHSRKDRPRAAGSYPLYVAAHTLFSCGNFTYAFFLLRAQDAGVRVELVPVLYLWHNIVYAAVALPAGVALDRWGLRPTVVTGYLLHAATCLGFAFGAQPLMLLVWFALLGVQLGVTGGACRATVAALARPQRLGSDMGLFNACEGFGVLAAGVISGQLWQRTGLAQAPFVYGATMAAAGALLAWVALRGRAPGSAA
jgi:MFS family permease